MNIRSVLFGINIAKNYFNLAKAFVLRLLKMILKSNRGLLA